MSFLNLSFLWLLPLALLPVIIHLLNRMRYQTKAWAALDFLMGSKKRSKAISRLRHILVLLFRVLMVLFLIFAFARPIIGGWLGGIFEGSPENIILVFDRSASMATIPDKSGFSRLDKSVKLVSELAKQYKNSHFILLDSASSEIKPLKNLSYIQNSKTFGVTETYSALPKLVNKAVDFYKNNSLGKTEIWVISDYQKSNWNENSPRWKKLAKSKDDNKLKFRLFLSGKKVEENIAIRISNTYTVNENDKYYLYLNCQLLQSKEKLKSLILTFIVNGIEDKLPITLQGKNLEFNHKIEISKEFYNSGYGYVELPFDSQKNDNRYYFAYAKDHPFNAAIISSDEKRAGLLKLLSAPYANNPNYKSIIYDGLAHVSQELDKLSLLIIDGVDILPQYAENILKYVKRGGYVLLMPPIKDKGMILDAFKLDDIQEFEDEGIRVTYWEKNFGPFAKSSFGKSLPLNTLKIKRRQTAQGGISLAEYDDGLAFINRYFYGLGSIYYCSTSVDSKWSNLDQGVVLLPMLHRMMQKANERFSNVKNDFLGESILTLRLKPLLRHSSNHFLFNSGVYEDEQYRYSLNRPPLEDDFELISDSTINKLFKAVDVDSSFEEKSDEEVDEITSLWTFFISLILICMFGEAFITLGKKTHQIKKERY